MQVLFLLMSLWLLREHPIHVSVSDVVIQQEKIEWTARIYKDDLLLGLYGKHVDPALLENPAKTRSDILRYMQKHVRVTLGAEPLTWTITDLHPDPEAMWITLTADLREQDVSALQLHPTMLMEVYDDQKNIVNIEKPSSKPITLIFESGDKEKSVTF